MQFLPEKYAAMLGQKRKGHSPCAGLKTRFLGWLPQLYARRAHENDLMAVMLVEWLIHLRLWAPNPKPANPATETHRGTE